MKTEETVIHAFQSIITSWKTWDLHGFVLGSLCLQILLFFISPLRKRSSNGLLGGFIWVAYQLVHMFISRALITSSSKNEPKSEKPYLYTLWAVFLIMHFGGPDTITALSVEDNDLWGRSYADLSTQIVATVNVAVGAPISQWPFFGLPTTVCIFVAGSIKAIERIWCFKNASLTAFQRSLTPSRANPGPDYAATVEEYNFYKEHRIPVKFDDILQDTEPLNSGSGAASGIEELNDDQILKQAYYFYNKFRGMYIDMMFCCHDRDESRKIFLKLSPGDAFRVVETEMKFAYEAFYTKKHFTSNPRWMRIRCVSFILELLAAATTFLWFKEGNHHFLPIEYFITGSLISWALVCDVLAFIRLQRSDWKIALSTNSNKASPQVPRPIEQASTRPLSHKPGCILFRQWSESISKFNFINYCLDERSQILEKVFTLIGANDAIESYWYVSNIWLTNELREFIFQNLRETSLMAENLDTLEEVSSSRGSWTLRYHASSDLDPATFEPWIMNVEYDESLLIWHIATELCYETELEPDNSDEHRKFSKILSDYMVYLFYKQPGMMVEIAPMAKVIFRDTCAEARRLIHGAKDSTSSCSLPSPEMKAGLIDQFTCAQQARRIFHWVMGTCTSSCCLSKGTKEQNHRQECKRIMEVRTDLASPREVKGEFSMSVLFEACQLAKHLLYLKNKKVDHWELISQIWVDILCYTATHTQGAAHASLLCQGGELVTLVRLLTLHLGTSSHFRKANYTPRLELLLDA